MTGWTPQGLAVIALVVAVLVLGLALIGRDEA
jgi:hypothetical protein